MQNLSVNYLVFGLTLGTLFLFGIVYAALVRRLTVNKVEGQTAYAVVAGVGVTVLASAGLIGWHNVVLILACFAASGLPMVVEYAHRVHVERARDAEKARQVAKDMFR